MTNAMTTTNYSAIKKYANSEEIKQIFRGIVGNEHAEGYIYSVIVAVSASDQLQQCTPQSIMRSAARAATLGLSCDPALGQAYLVPFKDEATLIPGWRGIRDMAYRTGQIAKINVGFLAEGQEWVEDQLTGDGHIEGIPKSNKPVGYFAYMKTFSGREHSLYMSNEDIQAHKEKYAKGFNRANSAWNTDFHKMAKKTVLSQLLKQWAPLDPTGAVVANLEYAADGIDEMPDPSEVTIIEGERRSNKQIMSDLGFDQEDDVEDAEFTETESEDETEVQDTGAPADIGELKTWAVDGNLKGVTYKDVDKIYKTTGENLADTWLIVKKKVHASLEASGQEALL